MTTDLRLRIPRDVAEAIGRALLVGTASCRGVGIKARAARGTGTGIQLRVNGRWCEPREAAELLAKRPRPTIELITVHYDEEVSDGR